MRRIDLFRALVLALCALPFVAPATSAQTISLCPSQPVSQVFLPWSDPGSYASVPDGGMEARDGGWRLDGAAAFVAGNETYFVRAPSDAWALELGPDASAVSARTCIGIGHPTLRLFARTSKPTASTLRISVEFADLAGVRRTQEIARLTAGGSWAPTTPVLIVANALSLLKPQWVAFRFTAIGGRWQLDDAYVDPYGKG
jgi:hypothetical protein